MSTILLQPAAEVAAIRHGDNTDGIYSEVGRNRGPQPVRTVKHSAQCPRCLWWFTKSGIKRHVCYAPDPVADDIGLRSKAAEEEQQ